MVDDTVSPRVPAPQADLPQPHIWSSAEFVDRQFPGGITLRALVCPLEGGKWQWSVISLDGTRGEVIGVGIEQSAAEARLIAVSEVAKCFSDPLE
jgi:hypothetical protein